ncbi:MAG: hypothetical protein AB4080_06430 [Trichodesmium sp.]
MSAKNLVIFSTKISLKPLSINPLTFNHPNLIRVCAHKSDGGVRSEGVGVIHELPLRVKRITPTSQEERGVPQEAI